MWYWVGAEPLQILFLMLTMTIPKIRELIVTTSRYLP